MMIRRSCYNRRRFLRGAGGIAVGLPFLETFAARQAWAAPPKRFAVYFQCNGVNKDRWWPRTPFGALTPESLVGTALEPLQAHAARLLIPRPLNGFPKGYGQDGVPVDDHNLGMCAKLTCAPPHTMSDAAKGPSIDDVIARSINPGARGPLLLHVGEMAGGRIGAAFYTASGQPAAREPNPWNAFKAWVGSGTTPVGPPVVDYLALRKKSVLDAVKDDLKSLQGNPVLGKADRQKLDMHFGAVRSLETTAGAGMPVGGASPVAACTLGDARNKEIEAGGGDFVRNASMMMEIAALALACDYNRVVGIQLSVGAGGPRYDWLPDALNKVHRHHPLSHGATADNATMPNLPEAEYKTALFNIDLWHMQTLNLLLTRLASYSEPGGSVLDNAAVLYINELSNGLAHSHEELPILLAGSAGGALKQRQYVNITRLVDPNAYGKPCTPPFFITLANALGYRDATGAPMMRFGNPTAKGRLPQAGEHAELKV
jgi:hypothetical protein